MGPIKVHREYEKISREQSDENKRRKQRVSGKKY